MSTDFLTKDGEVNLTLAETILEELGGIEAVIFQKRKERNFPLILFFLSFFFFKTIKLKQSIQ